DNDGTSCRRGGKRQLKGKSSSFLVSNVRTEHGNICPNESRNSRARPYVQRNLYNVDELQFPVSTICEENHNARTSCRQQGGKRGWKESLPLKFQVSSSRNNRVATIGDNNDNIGTSCCPGVEQQFEGKSPPELA
ncbi:Hypothetical predicted protein, partial [Paramuricea clavata]